MTATIATAARTAPAQVGAGRTVHETNAEQFSSDTLCDRPVSRVLTAEQAAKMGKPCKQCAKALEELTAPAAEDAPIADAEEVGAPAVDAEGIPQVDDAEPTTAELVQDEEPAQAEGAPEADDVEPAPEELVQVTAYTAAVDVLHANGQDDDNRVLALNADAVLETVAKMRRMPRWNAAQDRFTVNKVAAIVARDAQGARVWVRGEAAPIRVDLAGTSIESDAPAETGNVDVAAILAATRPLRRRAEVQRVIDNRTRAMAMSTPAPAEGPAPAPVVEKAPEPAPVEEEVAYDAPQWRTLKGLDAPFQLYGTRSGKWFRPSGDRKQCTGDALDIVRTWTATGARYAEDVAGDTHSLGGTATRYWIATPTA
ncbi:hypothetical protein [Streptomyces anulatus]|uniref:hypothetical protein n=1 Tax=Streptomyces anulatus TaxID=1892 RepID=UPI0036A9ACC8